MVINMEKVFNKGTFAEHIAKEHGITKKEAESIIEIFTSSITSALKEGSEINFLGFGKFTVSYVEARTGRKPKTGEELKILAYNQPKFKAGKGLKDACNGK